jgi:hypothetical protein
MAFTGTIAAPVLGGIFPLLMLLASRRKGEYVPGRVWRFVGHPLIIGGVYLIFLTSLLAYGLLIWSDPLPRLGALLAVTVVLSMTIMLVRQGAFTSRTIVELRVNQHRPEATVFTITSAGHPLPADVYLTYQAGEQHLRAAIGDVPNFHALRLLTVQLPPLPTKELKVWVHQLTLDAFSETMPAYVMIHQGSDQQEFDLRSAGTQVLVPMNGQTCRVEIRL